MNRPETPIRREEARLPGGGSLLMRRYAPVSFAVHVVAITLLSLPAIRPERPVYAQPIYEVALVPWPEPNHQPALPASSRKPAAPPVKTPKEETKPKDTIPVKSSKPKTKAVSKPESKPEPKAVDPTKQAGDKPDPGVDRTNLESQPDAPPGEGRPVSLGQVDQPDFRHDYYLELLRSILAQFWDPPPGGDGILTVSVHFLIERDGTISTPEVVGSSGWTLYDRSALGAVLTARKLPPLPEAYEGDHLGLTVNFQRVGEAP